MLQLIIFMGIIFIGQMEVHLPLVEMEHKGFKGYRVFKVYKGFKG